MVILLLLTGVAIACLLAVRALRHGSDFDPYPYHQRRKGRCNSEKNDCG